MSCSISLPARTQMLSAWDNTGFFAPMTEWVPCTALDKARVVMTLRNEIGNFSCQPAYQFAEVRTSEPKAHVVFGTAQTSVGEDFFEKADFGAPGGDNNTNMYWIRFGVEFKSNIAGNRGQAQVTLAVTFERRGRALGQRAGAQVRSYAGNTDKKYLSVTDWLPALGLTSVKAAFVTSDATGTLKYGLAYRAAATDRLAPGNWTPLGTEQTASGNGSYLQADAALTLTSKTWVQVGLYFSNAAAGTDGQATIKCSIAGSYA